MRYIKEAFYLALYLTGYILSKPLLYGSSSSKKKIDLTWMPETDILLLYNDFYCQQKKFFNNEII